MIHFPHSQVKTPYFSAHLQPGNIRFQGNKVQFDADHVAALKHRAENGSADSQLDYAMHLYDHAIPRRAKLKSTIFRMISMDGLALTPLVRSKNLPDDAIECYKWFFLAQMKNHELMPNFADSWLSRLDFILPKESIQEAKRRAQVWLAEFGSEHRGPKPLDLLDSQPN